MDNVWKQTAQEHFEAPALQDDDDADVIIIGGGFSGLSCGLHLALAGAKAVLLEAKTIGYGGSGRNVGLANAGLWTPPDDVEALMGADAGKRLNTSLAKAPDLVFGLIDQWDIQCEATRNGTLHCAVGQAGMADLKKRYEQQKKRGAPVQLLDKDEAVRRIGSQAFEGALFDARAGTIHPLAYARGLARAAKTSGLSIFEKSVVTAVKRDGNMWQVTANGKTVRAKQVIDATNGYGAVPSTSKSYTPVHYFQCATAPIDNRLREKILPGLEGCWDTKSVMSSFRMDLDGRLLIGAVGSLDYAGQSIHKDWAHRKLAALFPDLAGHSFEAAWTGRIAMTDDHLPKLVNHAQGLLSIYGYSGRGIGPGSMMGKCLAEWIMSGRDDILPLPIQTSHTDAMNAMKAIGYEAGATMFHFIDARI